MSDKNYVTYEEFGAKGDGVTEDFAAIKAAHDFANENGLAIKGRPGAHYYIHDTRINGNAEVAKIMTDVDWTGVEFTIDDRDISHFKNDPTHGMHDKDIFLAVSEYPMVKIDDRAILDRVERDGLNKKTTKTELGLGYPAMIIPYCLSHRVYRRRGYGGFSGAYMHEVLVLDKDGNIDSDAPVMFDYPRLDYIEVYRLDIKPITVKGGKFTTRASRVNCMIMNSKGELEPHDDYIARGIRIMRSFTTLDGVEHYVTDEFSVSEQVKDGKIVCIGNAYEGFFYASFANEVTYKNCVLTGRRCFTTPKNGTTGTYDLGGKCVNKIRFIGCTQSNFWIKLDENDNITAAKEGDEGAITSMYWIPRANQKIKLHWGVGGTNFCKNMEYIDSTLSRFDAHSGLYNGKIINSTVNYMAITGNGNFIVENTRWFAEGPDYNANSLIHLRADYGSTWEGEIKMKNVEANVYTTAPIYLYMHAYSNWYYGYRAHYPTLSIDNIVFKDIANGKLLPNGTEVLISGDGIKDEPAMHLPETKRVHPLYPDIDLDGDGLVDGTNIPYDDVVSTSGILDASSYKNLNMVVPPKHIVITGNKNASVDGKCRIVVYDTSNYKDVADGGFFGKTEFITDGHKYVGTDFAGQDTETFKFIAIE